MRRVRNVIVIAGAIAFALSGCTAHHPSGAKGIAYLEPAPVPVASFRVVGKEYRFEKDGLVVVTAFLGEKGLEDYYVGQGLVNPFAVIYPVLRPTVFVVRIENRSQKSLFFTPSMSGVVDNAGKPYVNRDLTDFYPYLGNDEERRARMSALQATLFDTQIRLSPGSSAERLIAFDALGEDVQGVKLILRDLYVGDMPVDLPFPFSCHYR